MVETEENVALVTGASGFIGRHLVDALIDSSNFRIRTLQRPASVSDRPNQWPVARVQIVPADLTDTASLAGICDQVDTVFHLAGYAHAGDSEQASGNAVHRRVTVEGTKALIDQAIVAGVRKFVFVSSVKASGEGSDAALDEDSPTLPTTGYGRAKREAEEMVLTAGRQHGFHAVVLRLPLVYGRDNKGNIPKMIAAIDRGRFPPLPEVGNKRSMIHVEDVVRALVLVGDAPKARGQRYIVTDGRVYSSRELYELICRGLGKRIPRWSTPVTILRGAALAGDAIEAVLGRPFVFDSETLTKLLGSACYSSEKIRRELGFTARRTLVDALPEMIDDYRKRP